MTARQYALSACAIALLAAFMLVSGCVLSGNGNGTATLTPSSSTAVPAPAGLYLDPPVPNETTTDVGQAPVLQEPAARVPFVDPISGTRLVRVTDRKTDIARGDTSAGLGNEFSRAQAFSPDGVSYLLLRGTGGSWYLYDAYKLLPVGRLPFDAAAEPRWDNAHDNILYYIDGPRFMRYTPVAQERTTVHDFSGEFSPHTPANVWTHGEGSPSMDGHYWGLMAQGAGGKTFAFIIYDPAADQIVARRDITPTMGVKSVTMSPLGDYFVAIFEPLPGNAMGSDASPGGLMVYDKDLKNGRGLVRAAGSWDIALDARDREVIVYRDDDSRTIAMCDLATGETISLCPGDSIPVTMSLSISGRAFEAPGWAIVSTYESDPASHTGLSNKIFALELKQDGRLILLARTHSQAAPQVTVDLDLTRVLFSSTWDRSDTAAVDTYMIVLPRGWTERLI